MSTSDDQSKESQEVAAAEKTDLEPIEPGQSSVGHVVLFFIVGFVASLVLGWVIFPKLLYSTKPQPFNYSHAIHNELVDEGCESCHYFREDGSFSGIPSLESCVECHEEMQGDSEDEAIFMEEYVAKDREIPWHVYSRQPDCVFFSHAAHVKMGKMDCVTCHGHIGESDQLPTYKENRISTYSIDIWGRNISGIKRNSWDRMKMNDCANCHRENGVNQRSVQTRKGGCFVCHN